VGQANSWDFQQEGGSRIISYGNACTLDSTEFRDHLTTNPDAEMITVYLEEVDGSSKPAL